jgi:hypothetical protein
MFGMGRNNLVVGRLLNAEYWFTKAFNSEPDVTYRIWLGYTYMKMSESLPNGHKEKKKLLEKAIDHFQECLEEPKVGEIASFCLLYISIKAKQSFTGKDAIKSLEEPQNYAVMMKQVDQINLYQAHIAWGYVYLNFEGQSDVGEDVITDLVNDKPERIDGYLMLFSYLLSEAKK